MNLGIHIHELLLENETVIIPGFGAFVSVYKPAEIQGDEIKPPSKEVSFTQQIRNNDGLLVSHVSNQEGISHFEALKTIDKQRENLIYLLDKGERVVLEKTGVLWFNANNEMEFEPFFDDNLLLDSYGLESISTKLMEQKADVIIEVEEEVEEEISDGESENHPESTEQDVPKIPEEPAISVIDKIRSSNNTKEPEERKKRSALWYLLLLIPIVIAGVFMLVNLRNSPKPEKTMEQEKNVALEEAPLARPDALLDDALENELDRAEAIAEVIADSVENPIRKPERKVGTGSSKYYLVGGSFKKEDNAKDFVDALKDEGFDAFLLEKRGSFYLVAIGTYSSESEALNARSSITKNDTAKNLWVLEE